MTLSQVGLGQMLKGGVIMDVTNVEEARIAEEAGAVAVMALERVPADIRRDGGVARMSDPTMIKAIKVQYKSATKIFQSMTESVATEAILTTVELLPLSGCDHHPCHGQGTHWPLC